MANFETPKLLIEEFVAICERGIGELLPMYRALGESDCFTLQQCSDLAILSSACLRQSGAVLLLVEQGRPWDAEVLMRSVFEGTLKFAYILEDKSCLEARYKEFSEILPDIALLKNDARARELLRVVANDQDEQWRPIRDLLISPEKAQEIQSLYPRRYRQQLESKWSVSGLVHELTQSTMAGASLLPGLLHGYTVSSRVVHMDYLGVSIVAERESRDCERRVSANIAHCTRLLSDAYEYTFHRLWTIFSFIGGDKKPLVQAHQSYVNDSAPMAAAAKEWREIEYPQNV